MSPEEACAEEVPEPVELELVLVLPVSPAELVPPLLVPEVVPVPVLVELVLVVLDDPEPASPVGVLVVVVVAAEDVVPELDVVVVGAVVVLVVVGAVATVVVGAVATVVVVPESLPNVPVDPPSV